MDSAGLRFWNTEHQAISVPYETVCNQISGMHIAVNGIMSLICTSGLGIVVSRSGPTFTCPIGYFYDQASCTPCPAGSFRDISSTRMFQCDLCPAGFSTEGNTGQLTCAPCPPGSFSSTAGSAYCGFCPTFVDPTRTLCSNATTCPPNYRRTLDHTCVACAIGMSSSGGEECSPCNPGSYTPSEGSGCRPFSVSGLSAPGGILQVILASALASALCISHATGLCAAFQRGGDESYGNCFHLPAASPIRIAQHLSSGQFGTRRIRCAAAARHRPPIRVYVAKWWSHRRICVQTPRCIDRAISIGVTLWLGRSAYGCCQC